MQTRPTTGARQWAVRAVLSAGLLAPAAAYAHEKWFVDPAAYPLHLELLWSWPVALALGAAGLALGGLLLLQRIVRDPLWPNPTWLRPLDASARAVIGIQTAVSLIYMAVQGWLFSPVQPLPHNLLGLALGGLVAGAAFSFITGWLTRLGGAVLLGLVALSFLLYPVANALEQVLFAGIGVYFLILGRGLFAPTFPSTRRWARTWQPYERWALPALRISTGAAILVLAFTEKLLNPALARAFLTAYPTFNFMHLAGFTWFSDDLFITAAAVVEATVGILLIAGVLPRVVILLMWVPFNAAIPFLPPVELLGHLPILAVMYVVFLQGVGTEGALGEPVAGRTAPPVAARVGAPRPPGPTGPSDRYKSGRGGVRGDGQ